MSPCKSDAVHKCLLVQRNRRGKVSPRAKMTHRAKESPCKSVPSAKESSGYNHLTKYYLQVYNDYGGGSKGHYRAIGKLDVIV